MVTQRMGRVVPLIALGSLLFAFTACDNTATGLQNETEKEEFALEEHAKEADQALKQEIAEFKFDANRRLYELDKSIVRIDKKLEITAADTKEELSDQREDLRSDRDELQKELDEIDAETEEDWRETKLAIDKRFATVGVSVNQLLDDLGVSVEDVTE